MSYARDDGQMADEEDMGEMDDMGMGDGSMDMEEPSVMEPEEEMDMGADEGEVEFDSVEDLQRVLINGLESEGGKEAIKNAELEELRRIEKIENMNEQEFISFVRYNHDKLSKHFKNGGVSRLGHGVESMSWQTSKYIIESTIGTNDFNESIKIYRKSDKAKIFSGGWGYGD